MSKAIIEVNGVSKRYTLGDLGASTLREAFSNSLARLTRKSSANGTSETKSERDFWALKDISFTVNPGEIVGVVGRNGAGKSTLLKILSRITEPTAGEIILRGKVASLLEVGTGFHPELSGRDNIYLNGAILGMSKAEISRKFDEIVDFSEIELFIDTPVKRYSSGMYVRLAFAVAAHLDPDILIVDEVLAVGDAKFQMKCLGKIRSVSQSGRTVLFVSHSMDTVLRLCSKGLFLRAGTVEFSGDAKDAASLYMRSTSNQESDFDLEKKPRLSHLRLALRLARLECLESGVPSKHIPYGEELSIRVKFRCEIATPNIQVGFAISNLSGLEIASGLSAPIDGGKPLEPGDYQVTLTFDHLNLLPNAYALGVGIKSERGEEDHIPEAGDFEITQSELSSAIRADTFRGLISPPFRVSLEKASS